MVRLTAGALALLLVPNVAASQTPTGTVRSVSVTAGAEVVEREAARQVTPVTAFSTDDLYRAEWLIPNESDPEYGGAILAFAGGEEARAARHSARPFDEVVVRVVSGTFLPGTRLQAFRVTRSVTGLGDVVTPTGLLTVQETRAGMVVATVSKIYGRMALGDYVGPLPDFTLLPGAEAQPVAGAMQAEVIGFPRPNELHAPGAYAFLGVGSSDGVRAGDIFDVVWTEVQGGPERVEGRIRIVRVDGDHSTGRIMEMTNPVFHTGVWVKLSARMR
jgi:hypothetical protein